MTSEYGMTFRWAVADRLHPVALAIGERRSLGHEPKAR
jgi:hypothetical protein